MRTLNQQRHLRLPAVVCLALLAAVSLASSVFATEVVDCTEIDFLDALVSGDPVTFPEDCSITLTDTVLIDSDTTIDAQGHNVTINGDGQFRIFEVGADVTLTIIGVAFTGGLNTNGAALFINTGANVVLSNCTFI